MTELLILIFKGADRDDDIYAYLITCLPWFLPRAFALVFLTKFKIAHKEIGYYGGMRDT